MVNETNKPQESLENEQLGQRLAASNQALADMQAEHNQLLEEMEQLRRRAEDLQHLKEQQEREEEERRLQYQQTVTTAAESLEMVKTYEQQKEEKTNDGEVDPAEADYIKEKLAEIARLKAQFKRVQHMINTTELIENHISKNEVSQKDLAKETNKPKAKEENKVKPQTTSAATPTAGVTPIVPEFTAMPQMPTMADLEAASTADEKEQLILTMLNMFQDFSTDLKSQADNLRAERERIKELKESIIRAKK